MTNKTIARALRRAADLTDLAGGNPFRARAFAAASRAIERLDTPAEPLILDGSITGLPGIGAGLLRDLRELLLTGTLPAADALIASLPPGLPDLLRIRGLGVKKVRRLWTELDVTSLDDLEAAAAGGRLEALGGFGPTSVQNILSGIEEVRAYSGQAHLRDAVPAAMALRAALRAGGAHAEVAGETRRHANTVATIELVSTGRVEATAEALRAAGVTTVYAEADSVRGRHPLGPAVAVHLTTPERFGTALWRHTGPEAHVAAVAERLASVPDVPEEADLYAAAGLAPVPPPLRDDLRRLDDAATGALPDLLRTADLRGTIHNHTTASDGAHSLAEMAEAARERGLGYFGVCDHSQSLHVANGLSPERLRQQLREVATLNADYAARGIDFRVFSGSEVDILADGSLDYPDELLARLDVVVASIHTGFSMSADEATARVVRAVQNPHVDVLGHPTGRLLLRRPGYPLDPLAVLDACAAHGVAVELNANPWRLDADWTWIPEAQARGVPIAINPDAHAAEGLDDTRWGVAAAQKGGLTAEGSLTSLDADALAAWLHGRPGRA